MNGQLMMGSNSNSESVADSIVMTTLLTSMRTKNPIIDALTSLVVTSKFKNNITRNLSIVFTLLTGTIMSRVSDKYDILMYIYNLKNLVNYRIPFMRHQTEVLMKNYIEKNTYYFDDSEKYSILAVFFKILEDKSVKRVKIKREDYLFDESAPTYTDLIKIEKPFLDRHKNTMNYIEKFNESIYTKSIDIIRYPPETGKWYELDGGIWFKYNIVNKTQMDQEPKEKSSKTSGETEHYYSIILQSNKKSEKEIKEYVVGLRKDLMAKYVTYDDKIEKEKGDKLKNVKEVDYRGSLIEVSKKYDHDSKPTKITWERTIVNNFCRPFDSVFFNEKEDFTKILNQFTKKSGIYKKLPHKHKLGIMLHGSPGSGKSSLAAAIATKLKRNIIRVNLKDNDMDDEKLSYIFSNFSQGYVIILDELDTCEEFRPRKKEDLLSKKGNPNQKTDFFQKIMLENFMKKRKKKRKKKNTEPDSDSDSDNESVVECRNVDKYKKLHLGNFLELLDGVSFSSSRVVIAMTNHPDMLDPAILRPGRFDVMINMKPLDLENLKKYINHIFEDFDISQQEITHAAEYCLKNHTKSAILEQACIERYGNDKKTLSEHVAFIVESFQIKEKVKNTDSDSDIVDTSSDTTGVISDIVDTSSDIGDTYKHDKSSENSYDEISSSTSMSSIHSTDPD